MEIQRFIEETSKRIIPVSELTTIAADRRGVWRRRDRRRSRSQIELRSTQAQTVLDAAEKADRDSAARERTAQLRRARSANAIRFSACSGRSNGAPRQRGFVPATQTVTRQTHRDDASPVLTPETADARLARTQRRDVWLSAGPGADSTARSARIVRGAGDRRSRGLSGPRSARAV